MLDASARTRALAAINDALRRTGWSASRLAREAEIAPSTLNRFLKDPDNHPIIPSTRTLAKIAEAAAKAAPNQPPRTNGSAITDEDHLQARGQDLVEAMGAKLPRPKVVKLGRLLARLAKAGPEEAERILDEMIATVEE